MTDLERESLEVFYEVRDSLTARTISFRSFTELMGRVRMMIKHLENLSFGCPSGKHSSVCTCRPGVPGKSYQGKIM